MNLSEKNRLHCNLTMTRSMKPVKSKVNDDQSKEPHPKTVPRKTYHSIIFVNVRVEDDVEGGENYSVSIKDTIVKD